MAAEPAPAQSAAQLTRVDPDPTDAIPDRRGCYRRPVRRAWACLTSLPLLLSCAPADPTPTYWRPVDRLLDGPIPGRRGNPTQEIDHDARRVLRPFATLRLLHETRRLPPDGVLRSDLPLPPAFAKKDWAVIEIRSKPAGERASVDHVATLVVPVVRLEGQSFARIECPIAASAADAGRERLISIALQRLPAQTIAIEAPARPVPAQARLDFAIGIAENAWDQGPVEFRLEACPPGGCREIFRETVDPASSDRGRWRDRSVTLDACADLHCAFRFESRHLAAGDRSYSLPFWGEPILIAPADPQPTPRRIVLLSLDTLRANHLQSYGHDRETAPFLDAALFPQGTLFEQAYTAATTTTPSHMTLFTSLLPSVHRIVGIGSTTPLTLPIPTLPELLRQAGFTTGAITENGAILRGRGFERGFDSYWENPVPMPHRIGVQSAHTFARALDWLSTKRDRDFFLFLHTYEVHEPYEPPEAHRSHFAGTRTLHASDRAIAQHQALRYDQEIRYLDERLADFFAGLERLGLAEGTLVILTSDHGEEFLDHAFWGHGATPYDEVLHVPLFVRGPRISAGRRIDAPVSLLDIQPTLLELFGLPAPPHTMGRSFAGLLHGGDGAEWRERPIFSEAWYGYGRTEGGGKRDMEQPSLALRIGPHKLLRFEAKGAPHYEFYDLSSDPLERVDRYAEEAERARPLVEQIEGYEESMRRVREELRKGASAQRNEKVEAPLEHEDRLRALGYVE